MLEQGLLQILEKVYEERGFDFRQYKESSLKRRIEKRLRAKKAGSYEEYAKILDTDPDEYKRLVDALTIKVTEFFRDPEAWQVLSERVLPEIIRGKTGDTRLHKRSGGQGKENENITPVLRVWSAGCATGQETYSVAILLNQLLEERKDALQIDICGTDIDKDSLIKAQQGEYKSEMMKNVPQDIRDKYFDPRNSFRVRDPLRKIVYFKFHDLALEGPLKGIDLILCRNVAIYFDRSLQEKIFMDFRNGLGEGGYLFLGKAETLIGPAQGRFNVVDRRWKIYRKLDWADEDEEKE